MKEIVIISGKGGTGKTSFVSSFAALAENKILADCDVDAPDLHLILNPSVKEKFDFFGIKSPKINPEKCLECGICRSVCRFDAIDENFQLIDVACEGCGVCVWNCPHGAIDYLDKKRGECYISTTRYGSMVHAQLGIAEENSGKLVSMVREKARKIASDEKADLILVDGPPGIGCPVIASIGGVDFVVVVSEPTLSAIHDMKRVVKLAEHFKVPVGICINKYNLNEEMTQHIKDFASKQKIVILGEIPYSSDFYKAQKFGQNILEYNNDFRKPFSEIWKSILNNINGDKNGL